MEIVQQFSADNEKAFSLEKNYSIAPTAAATANANADVANADVAGGINTAVHVTALCTVCTISIRRSLLISLVLCTTLICSVLYCTVLYCTVLFFSFFPTPFLKSLLSIVLVTNDYLTNRVLIPCYNLGNTLVAPC